ncbi:hypothetical protein CSUI_000559 [Cystoisospora suis]|uniref:Uncharacterized protein n=1 Tax=Cystoisospora suis TaxID=483139 RepID=A0A2C6LG41_9APIC|nr:hypothetical protein CSUI_000559 [Cystoisospora suis]
MMRREDGVGLGTTRRVTDREGTPFRLKKMVSTRRQTLPPGSRTTATANVTRLSASSSLGSETTTKKESQRTVKNSPRSIQNGCVETTEAVGVRGVAKYTRAKKGRTNDLNRDKERDSLHVLRRGKRIKTVASTYTLKTPESGVIQEAGHCVNEGEKQAEDTVSEDQRTWVRILSVPSWYSLASTVCSYGYFCMEPNQWKPPTPPSRAMSARPAHNGEVGSPITCRGDVSESTGRHRQSEGLPQQNCLSLGLENGHVASVRNAPCGGRKSLRSKAVHANPSTHVDSGIGREKQGKEEKESELGVELGGVFERPLRYGEYMQKCCDIRLTMDGIGKLRMECGDRNASGEGFSPEDEEELVGQVQRMCRLSPGDLEHVQHFWRKHPQAARARFGLLFRSPTLWEDIVKTVTICNVRWKQSCVMNDLFCRRISSFPGSFPSPLDFLRFDAEDLPRLAGTGYRGDRLLRLAHRIVDGSLDLRQLDVGPPPPLTRPNLSSERLLDSELEMNSLTAKQSPLSSALSPSPTSLNDGETPATGATSRPSRSARTQQATVQQRAAGGIEGEDMERERLRDVLMKRLLAIHGIGPFAAQNVLQLLGFTEVDAYDSETIRHMEEVHGIKRKTVREVHELARKRFLPYKPYQFLAYWYELWQYYEKKVGSVSLYWTDQNSCFLLQDNKHLQHPSVTADGSMPAYLSAPERSPGSLLKQILKKGGLAFIHIPPRQMLAQKKDCVITSEVKSETQSTKEATKKAKTASSRIQRTPWGKKREKRLLSEAV